MSEEKCDDSSKLQHMERGIVQLHSGLVEFVFIKSKQFVDSCKCESTCGWQWPNVKDDSNRDEDEDGEREMRNGQTTSNSDDSIFLVN